MSNPTNLMQYKIIFFTALTLGQFLFLIRIRKKSWFALRWGACFLGTLAFVLWFPVYQYNAIYISFMFTLFFCVTIFTTKICYNIDWKGCVFCTIAGYSTQHLASVCYNLLLSVTFSGLNWQPYSEGSATNLNPIHILILIQVYALVYWCAYQLFGHRIRGRGDLQFKNQTLFVMLPLLIIVEIVLNAVIVYHNYANPDMIYYNTSALINIMCTLCVLHIQFYSLLETRLQTELDIVSDMWRQKRMQYQMTKETIDLINAKCHDMKHQVQAMELRGQLDKEVSREITDIISIYDSIPKTGNQALDIILAEKGLFCNQNSITLSYIMDGARLDFMRDADIYSLFGNLLDNAIEASLALPEKQRVIGLHAKAEGAFFSVNAHNYYFGEIKLKGGLPQTKKTDGRYHGFGFKSMVTIVEKYGGTIGFETKDEIFNLNLLFPLEVKSHKVNG